MWRALAPGAAGVELAHKVTMNLIKRSGPKYWIVVAMLFCPLALLAVYANDYSSSREREFGNGSARVRSFSHMYAEQISRSLGGVDVLVDELTTSLDEKPDWARWPQPRGHALLLAHKPRSQPQLRDTAVFDADGRQRFHSSLLPAPAISIVDRPYFAALRGGAKRVLFGPYKGRNTGVMTYALTRRLSHQDGGFAGVVFAAIELAQFQATCWNGKTEDLLRAFLVNLDGRIVAECRPAEEVASGMSAIGQLLATRYPGATGIDWRTEGVVLRDGQLIAVRRVPGYDELSVVATLSQDAVLVDWQADQQRGQLTLGMALATMLSSFFYILRQMRRQGRTEKKINELAFFDPLTRLPNRTLLMDRLSQAMHSGQRDGMSGALLFIDLDHFKILNDTLGHGKGDLLLRQVAQRVALCVREGDTVARLGGDEFVVVLENLSPDSGQAANQAEAVGEKILAAINQCNHLGAFEHRSSASIGATLFAGHQTPIDDLLRQADLAMYTAKDAGRDRLCFFDPAMQTVVMERAALEKEMRGALRERQFVLHYQPQVLADGRVTGAEALVRWNHPLRGVVSPAHFIPLAEASGMILPLGGWVLDSACQQLALWAAQPELAHLTVSVNVSAQQFREADFVERVEAALSQACADPRRLKLELTESLLVDNVSGTVEKMHALKARGIGFSLDDFGTGYSSLSYLKRLPLDQLKIDQSFVHDVLLDPNDAAIARTIVALARSLGLGVMAEGVESAQQRDFLVSVGCHAYQGYFFSRPVPIDAFDRYALAHPGAAPCPVDGLAA